MLKKLLDKIRNARFDKNRALSVNTNHKDTDNNMPAELQFVIPGIYISRASAESPNADSPKDMIRVYEESDTKENFFKTDTGREMSESEILSNYLLFSAFENEKKTADNGKKSKRLMRGFGEIPLEETPRNDVRQEPVVHKPVPRPQQTVTEQKIVLTEEQMSGAQLVAKEEQQTAQIAVKVPGPEISEFERSMLDQFVRIGEKVMVENIELPVNYDFEKVRTATKLLGLDKKRISNYIAFFIMQQPYLYETLSRKIEEMLTEEPQQPQSVQEKQPAINESKQEEPEQVKTEEPEIADEELHEESPEEQPVQSSAEQVEEEARNLSRLIDDYFSGK